MQRRLGVIRRAGIGAPDDPLSSYGMNARSSGKSVDGVSK
jgi:hypothetical protein